MAKYVERELTNVATEPTSQATELTELTQDEMERVSAGAFTFKTVAVKTVSWAHDG